MILESAIASLQAGLNVKFPELALWTISIAAYCILVFHFYRMVAKRDIFGYNALEIELERRDLSRHVSGTIAGLVKYGALFPIVVFIWFVGFSIVLFLLAREISVQQILLISVSFVTAIRLASYYNQALSRDMASLMPFVLLAAVIEPEFFSLALLEERVAGLGGFIPDLPVYFFFIMLVEWILRIALGIKHSMLGVSPHEGKE